MAQINITIPEPSVEYSSENQRQIIEALDTLKNQLNTSYQNDLKQETERFNWYIGAIK
jgi:DNA-binding ferritin-like protein